MSKKRNNEDLEISGSIISGSISYTEGKTINFPQLTINNDILYDAELAFTCEIQEETNVINKLLNEGKDFEASIDLTNFIYNLSNLYIDEQEKLTNLTTTLRLLKTVKEITDQGRGADLFKFSDEHASQTSVVNTNINFNQAADISRIPLADAVYHHADADYPLAGENKNNDHSLPASDI